MNSLFPVLQSGFIAASDKELSRPDSETDIVADYVLGATHLKNINNRFFSKVVTKLYNEWRNNREKMKDFAFRELILKQTKECFTFNTGLSCLKWFQMQFDTPMVSDMHVQFLVDTMKFVAGEERGLATFQWFSILEANTTIVPSQSTWDEVSRVFNHCLPSYDFYTVLQMWVSRPHGYEDLLTSLFVIYGERTAITTVNFKHS